MQKALDAKKKKNVWPDSLVKLVKNNIFEQRTTFSKQLKGTAIGTKMDAI